MPCWNDLLEEFNNTNPLVNLQNKLNESLNLISKLRNNKNVLFYASAFMQKQDVPQYTMQIMLEDLNGFMSTLYKMDWDKGLVLLLHTPGGVTSAAESIAEYLMKKFKHIEVIIPTIAMSAGTMISFIADKIILGKQSQLGPIDPQMYINNHFVSAQSIIDQFEMAKEEILNDNRTAQVWYPLLNSIGPALLQEAKNAIDYSEKMVSKWLSERMFINSKRREELSKKTSEYFKDASKHKNHGHPIGKDEIEKNTDLIIELLEDDQDLQDAVLTAYHIITIFFEKTPSVKILISNHKRSWIKNWTPPKL